MPGEPENELGSIVASARALLQWEEALGGTGVPVPEGGPDSTAAAGGGLEDAVARLEVLASEGRATTRTSRACRSSAAPVSSSTE